LRKKCTDKNYNLLVGTPCRKKEQLKFKQ